MPSRFEPCGLGQLIALRYGTIPIVRNTGGLSDTIQQYDRETGEGNGFVFEQYTGQAMMEAILHGLETYAEGSEVWDMLVKNAMNLDYSWKASALKYKDLYKSL
jgi:starch synthase